MPIDTNLALGVRPAQIPDPLEGYGRAVQLSSLLQQQDFQGMQMREAQRKLEGDRAAEEAYREALNPETGQIDQNRLLSSLAQRGQGSRIPGVQKTLLDAEAARLGVKKTAAEISAKEYETASKQFAGLNNMLGGLLSRPSVTHDDVIQGVAGLVQSGLLTQQAGQQAIAQLPGNVQMLRPWLQQRAFETVEAGKRLELLAPRRERVDTGGQIVFPDMNPFTNPNGPAPIPKEMTPGDLQQAADAAAGRAVTIRGQNLTDGRPTYDQERGGFVYRPSTQAPTGQFVPVSGPNGQPLPPKDLAVNETSLRKEFADLPQVKSFTQAAPAFKAVESAASRNTPQADINLVYGLAKLYDPNSVVREGEYATIANSQSIPEWLKGLAQRLSGGGRLTPETKAQIMTESRARLDSYRSEYDAARDRYASIAAQRGMNPDNVIVPIAVGTQAPSGGARPPLNAFQR